MEESIFGPVTNERVDGLAAFKDWAASESRKRRDPLKKASSALPYEAVWSSWLRFCSGRTFVSRGQPCPMHWLQASPSDVLAFLAPRAGMHSNHLPGRQFSPVTRRRYWRMLVRIYDHAVKKRWLKENPASLLLDIEAPAVAAQLGHVLPPDLWHALPEHLPTGTTLAERRDRALMLALHSLALTPEEVRSLTPQSITAGDVLHSGERHVQLFFRIEGARLAQKRLLALDDASADALRRWISARATHPPSKASKYLFCSQTGEQLSISALFHAVSKVLLSASHALASGSQAQSWTPRRVGPQVLRNTAIVHWLNSGVPLGEVLRRAGIKNAKGLYHLRGHLNEAVAALSLKV